MAAAMTDSERALWKQASDDYGHALMIAEKAWREVMPLDIVPEYAVIQAAAATILIHVTKLRSEERIHVRVPQSPAPAAVKREAVSSQAPVAAPPCPNCAGEMWDNRVNKKNPKGPDFKCKNKACLDDKGFVTALWERDLKKGNGRVNALAGKTTPESFGDMPTALNDGTDDLPF